MAGNVISFQKEKRLSFGVLVAEVARFEGSCHILLYGGALPWQIHEKEAAQPVC